MSYLFISNQKEKQSIS